MIDGIYYMYQNSFCSLLWLNHISYYRSLCCSCILCEFFLITIFSCYGKRGEVHQHHSSLSVVICNQCKVALICFNFPHFIFSFLLESHSFSASYIGIFFDTFAICFTKISKLWKIFNNFCFFLNVYKCFSILFSQHCF